MFKKEPFRFALGLTLLFSAYFIPVSHAAANDGRTRIIHSDNKITKKVGLIETAFDDETFGRCAGTLIDDYLVLTAAHCVANGQIKAETVTFYPNMRNVENERVRSYFGAGVLINKKFYQRTITRDSDDPITQYEVNHDIAVIHLARQSGQKAAGDRYGYESFAYRTNEHIRHKAVSLGYPKDKEQDTLWRSDCFATPLTKYVHNLECEIHQGNSGGPVLMKSTDGDETHIYSVVSALNKERGENYATRIRKPLFDDLVRMKNDQADGINHFVGFPLEIPSVSWISVRNKCFRDLQIGFKRFDPDTRRWEIKAWYKIEARETSEGLISTDSSAYYYYAETLDGDDVWRGNYDRGALRPMGDNGFRKKSLDYAGDHYLNLTCN